MLVLIAATYMEQNPVTRSGAHKQANQSYCSVEIKNADKQTDRQTEVEVEAKFIQSLQRPCGQYTVRCR